MHHCSSITLDTVRSVYDGAEGDLWEMLMGQQIHVGGLVSSLDLAEQAQIAAGSRGVDLCCCNGAGMRFLLRCRQVAHMTGVDATATVLERARSRNQAEGHGDQTTLVEADVCATGLAADAYDFAWGEDAWCYVADKPGLIAEAVRLVRPGGTIAFTDWLEGPAGLSDDEAARFMAFMKFPSLASLDDYRDLLEAQGCRIVSAADTGRYAAHIDLYLNMVGMQLTSDVQRMVGYNMDIFNAMAGAMQDMQALAHAGKLIQGRIIATVP